MPGMPTVAQDVPGYESGTMIAIFAPRATPAAAVQRLHREIAAVLARPEVQERFLAIGAEVITKFMMT